MRVKDNGESEYSTVMVGIEVETSLHTKVGRLPLGLESRENLENRF